MTSTIRLAYAEAYAIKDELGGGFRGVAQNKLTKDIAKGEIRATLDEARNDAKRFVFAWAGDRNMHTGSYPHSKTNWKMNYFIRSDEA